MKFNIQAVEQLQQDADELAYRLIKAMDLMQVQSLCDFNIFWMHDISPTFVDQRTISFMLEHKLKFKRKLSMREFINADFLLKNFEISTFDEFSVAFKNYKPEIFNNLLCKI